MNVYQLSAKNCMSHLLLKDTFDNFSFIEGEITTFNKFTISGFLQEDFFDEKPEETYSRWNKTRDFCFQIIRGKRTPLGFKIVLALPEDQIPYFLTAHGLTGYRPGRDPGAVPELPLRWTSLTMYHRNFSEHFHHGQIHRKRMGSGSKKHFKIQIH